MSHYNLIEKIKESEFLFNKKKAKRKLLKQRFENALQNTVSKEKFDSVVFENIKLKKENNTLREAMKEISAILEKR